MQRLQSLPLKRPTAVVDSVAVGWPTRSQLQSATGDEDGCSLAAGGTIRAAAERIRRGWPSGWTLRDGRERIEAMTTTTTATTTIWKKTELERRTGGRPANRCSV